MTDTVKQLLDDVFVRLVLKKDIFIRDALKHALWGRYQYHLDFKGVSSTPKQINSEIAEKLEREVGLTAVKWFTLLSHSHWPNFFQERENEMVYYTTPTEIYIQERDLLHRDRLLHFIKFEE
jgi:hypothetical protein